MMNLRKHFSEILSNLQKSKQKRSIKQAQKREPEIKTVRLHKIEKEVKVLKDILKDL